MTVAVKILPRKDVVDIQGRALGKTLQTQGYDIEKCTVGKFILLNLNGNENQCKEQAITIAENVLHNPLIETFEVEIL